MGNGLCFTYALTDPTDHYRKLLADLPRQRVERFMGGTINAAFVRMGDPLI